MQHGRFGAVVLVWGLLAAPAGAQIAPPTASKPTGAQLFQRQCGTCHTVEPGGSARQGPNLHGVIGRKAGAVPDFKYSAALAGADLTWDEARLDAFLANAQAVVPGVVMPYRQGNAEVRQTIIAYLKERS